MAEFRIVQKLESDIEVIEKCSQMAGDIGEKSRDIASDFNEWGSSYSGIYRSLIMMSDQILHECEALARYSEAGRLIISKYFAAEQKICGESASVFADSLIRVSASQGSMTKEQINNYINYLKTLIRNLLALLGLNSKLYEKYEGYLEKYRQYLYDQNGIDVVIIPTKPGGNSGNETQDPAIETNPEEKPESQPESKPEATPEPQPEQTPSEPVVQGPDRTPNYSNKLFDNKGMYGARQRLNSKDKDLYEVLRMFYPEWTDAQCKAQIERLAPEGCGYASMANAVFYSYEGRAEEFENAYGISMYKNGDLNYDELVLYLYTQYDNDTYQGLTPGEQNDILSDFLGQGGHSVNTSYFYQTSPSQIPDDLNKGFLTFSTQGAFDITPVNGGKTLHFEGAHDMSVTGVAPDGRLIVSTWGGKYYIDPATCKSPYYTLYQFDTR